MRLPAIAAVLAGCVAVPYPIRDIDWKAYKGFEYRYSALQRPVACEGPMIGDCTEYAARVQCLAAQRGLRSRLVLTPEPAPGHIHAEVLLDGTWWEVDLDGVRSVSP